MTNFKSTKSSYQECLNILKKTKEVVGKITQAALQVENPTKGRIDAALSQKSKNVEDAKFEFEKITQELQLLSQQIEAGKNRVAELTSEYEDLLQESEVLKKTEVSLMKQADINEEDIKAADELRWILKLYKMLTGIRFDFNAPDDVLSGYVGIKGSHSGVSNVVPFIIKKNEGNISEQLWDKIKEASIIEEDKEN